MIQLPILHTSSGDVRIEPVSASLDLELEPLSSAELELKPGETIPERSWVSVFTEHGLAGIFRSKPQKDRYGDRSSHVSLVHGAVEMNDWLTGKSDQTQASADSAISAIFQSYGGTKWSLGTVSPSNTVVYELNNSGVLDAITEIMEQIPGYMITFDQSSTPWVMNVVARPDEVSAEGRLSRNISSVEISRDDSSLCTRVYYGDNGAYVQDSTAVSKYGIIEHRISDSGFTAQQLAAIAQTYLDNHSEPKLSVSISAVNLYAITGETLDRITLGTKYRLAIPEADSEENRIIEQVVCSIRYDDLFSGNPQIILSSDPETIITFLKKQRKTVGRAVQQLKEDVVQQYQHWTTENNVYKESVYKIVGVQYDDDFEPIYQRDPATGEIIYDEAGNPMPVYYPESDGSIAGKVTQSAQNISTLYTKTGVNSLGQSETLYSKIEQNATEISSKVSAGDIASEINQTAQSVLIQASKIDLQGYVTASEIFATDTTIGQYLTANNAIFQTKVKTAALEATNGATIESGLSVSDGSTLTGGVVVDTLTVGYPASSGHQVTSTILGGMIKTASLDTSTNTLTLTKFNGDVINFSKAASQGTYTEGWGAAFQKVSWPTSGTSNAYIDVSAPIATVDGPADLRRFIIRNDDLNNDIAYISTLNSQNNTYTNYAMLNHGKYTAGQNSVTAVLTSATPPSGTTPPPLTNGTYGVFLSKGGVLDSTAVSYHSVTSGGSATYVVSTNGEPIMVWNGLSVVGSLYPNTDVVASSTTDQLGRRQISYNSGTISRTGYVSNSSLSSTKGSTNYPGRIGWTDEGGSGASRSVTSLSTVVLASTDITTSTHTVDVSYSDGNTVLGGATVTVDASAIAGGGANLGHHRFTANNTYYASSYNLDGFSSVEIAVPDTSGAVGGISTATIGLTSNSSSVYNTWSSDRAETLTSKYCRIKIDPLDSNCDSYYLKIDASGLAGDSYQLTSVTLQGSGPYTATRIDDNSSASFNRYGYEKLYYYDDDTGRYVEANSRARYWYYSTVDVSGGAYYKSGGTLTYYNAGQTVTDTYYIKT